MDYFGLKCFVEVVKNGSFSKAAQNLFRTQPAISLQIKKLEKELKTELLNRYKKEIVLTEAGSSLYKGAKELLDSIENLKKTTQKSIEEPEGNLIIATNLSIINNFLPPIIGEFRKKHPKVNFRFFNFTSGKVEESIKEGTAEIGIAFSKTQDPALEFKKLFESKFFIVSTKKTTSHNFSENNIIHFEPNNVIRSYVENHLKLKNGFKTTLELPSAEAILNYINQDMGTSIIPELLISDYWKNKLLLKPIDILPLPIYIITHKKRILSKAGEKFLKNLTEKF